MELEFEILAEGLEGPEGPIVLPDGSCILTEMRAHRISRIWGGGKKEIIAEMGGTPNGAALGADGAIYICNSGGEGVQHGDFGGGGRIERIDLATGRFERICDQVNGRPLSAPSDLVIDEAGGIWFTEFGTVRQRTIEKGGLFWCRPDGSEIRESYFGGLGFNGVALSPDNRSIHVAASWSGRLFSFAVESVGHLATSAETGTVVPRYAGSADGESVLDGLAVTASGGVCAATIIEGGIKTFRQDGGASFVSLPDKTVTNIAFGGTDMRDAYITLLRTGRLIRARWNEPGHLLNFAERP